MPESAVGRILWAAVVLFVAFVLFTALSAAFAMGSPLLGMGLLVAALLGYWTWAYRDEGETAADTVEKVGEEAEGFLGGILDSFSALVFWVGVVIITVGMEFFDLVDILFQLWRVEPVTTTTALVGGMIAFMAATGNELLLIFDVNGTPGLQPLEWAVPVFGLTVLAVFARRTLYGGARDR